jgi:sec-independent protein translocase protein TatA
MPDLGVPELIIIAVIVLLLFGPGKAADLGGSLGKGIREFRKATRDEDDTVAPAQLASASGPALAAPAGTEQGGAATRFCAECGTAAGDGKFCTNCGHAHGA